MNIEASPDSTVNRLFEQTHYEDVKLSLITLYYSILISK